MSKAQFKATVKDFKKNGKQMELKLLINKEDINPYALMNALDMVDSKIHVYLGDPQISFDFSDDMHYPPKRLSITTDHSGVVTSVNAQEIDDNSDDENSLDEGAEPDGPETDSKSDGDEFAIFDETTEEEDDSIPVFGETAEESEESEENEDKEDKESHSEDHATEVTNHKDVLENFILSGQVPVFEEITFDFPALLARRRNGETWIKIAASINTSSTKLQAEWSKYKKLVAEHMAKQNGEEPGAA
ncbi:hypothetical protein [Brevibacillus choshinensis]|uniref:hypothetical protein n=1 Tax=Brevibacillus choshinensis TaxID=54911 RepID=UPI002E21CAC0|nr:hypothetical protein [Brevibacillus choshinensis]